MATALVPRKTKFTVVGDLMVDEYVSGEVRRISPEGPIPIMEYGGIRRVPGGAANVALNLAGLGGDITVYGVVGDDEAGAWLRSYLEEHGVAVRGVIVDESRPTTRKVRFTASEHVMLRVDYESTAQVTSSVGSMLAERLLDEHDRYPAAILVSDYNKGCLVGEVERNPLLRALRTFADGNFLVGVDTKRVGPALREAYSGFDFAKPNLAEFQRVVGHEVRPETAHLTSAAQVYLQLAGTRAVVVSLGAAGLFFCDAATALHVETVPSAVYDVTGAGDTVLATLAMAVTGGSDWLTALRLANIAASIVIGYHGTRPITRAELNRRSHGKERIPFVRVDIA